MTPGVPGLTVSVVVPVRNGRHFLESLIPALELQTLPRTEFEVIISDDGSTDDPAQFATVDDHVRVLRHGATNSYTARNRGIVAARAISALAFCDADCIPEPTWLEQGLVALEDADLVAGRVLFTAPRRRNTWAFLDIETSKNQEALVRQGHAETANLFVRRDLVQSIGLFDERTASHGDFDFCERAVQSGAKLRYAESARVWHPVRQRARQFFGAHWQYSRSYAERATADGTRPLGLHLSQWVPVISVLRERMRWGMSLIGPDPAWLAKNGIELSLVERIKALPTIYLLLPYWRNAAQIQGWRDGRRHPSLGSEARTDRSEP